MVFSQLDFIKRGVEPCILARNLSEEKHALHDTDECLFPFSISQDDDYLLRRIMMNVKDLKRVGSVHVVLLRKIYFED